jgi:hypothetical protein
MGLKDLLGRRPGGAPSDPEPPVDAHAIDHPGILAMVFHPRRDAGPPPDGERVRELLFRVGEGAVIGSRLYAASSRAPVILYFHGNGEIASDYDDIAPLYIARGMNLLVVDYRGYGRSTGTPTLTGMIRDARDVFASARQQLEACGFQGRLWAMGRSLGSASALEIARSFGSQLGGVIVESGFADTVGLFQRVGIPVRRHAIPQAWARFNVMAVAQVTIPVLLIHGERDMLIPLADGEALLEACPSVRKELVVIPGAGHNDILWAGTGQYMDAVTRFVMGGP